MATVLKQQAAQAGITDQTQHARPRRLLHQNYLGYAFAQDFYNYSPYMSQVAYSMLPQSPFNETHKTTSTTQPLQRGEQDLRPGQAEADPARDAAVRLNEAATSSRPTSTRWTPTHRHHRVHPGQAGQPLANFTFENFSFV